MIYKIQDYYNKEGLHVKEFIVVEGETPADFPKYVGVGMMEIELGTGQVIPRQFSVNLESKTISEAFDELPGAMREAGPAAKDRFVKEMEEMHRERQKKIVIPNGTNTCT